MTEIMTIGYGGQRPSEFFDELARLGADVVVDVREDPFHAFLGAYTKPALEKRLGERYVWIPELGNKTRSLPPVLVDEEAGMRKLMTLMKRYDRIVLLCAERDERRCHRLYVKEKALRMVKC